MKFLKTLCLFCFAFGVAAMTKHYEMVSWIENNPWISLPLMIFGGVGVVIFFGGDC